MKFKNRQLYLNKCITLKKKGIGPSCDRIPGMSGFNIYRILHVVDKII